MTRAERKERLATLVSEGLTVPQAAIHMGIGRPYAWKLWADICRDLGPQAV